MHPGAGRRANDDPRRGSRSCAPDHRRAVRARGRRGPRRVDGVRGSRSRQHRRHRSGRPAAAAHGGADRGAGDAPGPNRRRSGRARRHPAGAPEGRLSAIFVMTDSYPVLGLATAHPTTIVAQQTVASLAPIVAPTLARTPGISPILAHHEPESPVAFGRAGERNAERLRTDVARVAAVLPDSVHDDPREILCVATDRYHFTVALLAAWQRGHRV